MLVVSKKLLKTVITGIATTIEINGHLEGRISADTVIIGRTAVVKGDIFFKSSLKTEEGADIDGYIKRANNGKSDTEEVINLSLNQMLSRTLITSLTTLLVLFSLYLFGGELIKNFALALIFGVVVGTYSSIYIASNALVMMGLTGEHLVVPEKENEDFNDLP